METVIFVLLAIILLLSSLLVAEHVKLNKVESDLRGYLADVSYAVTKAKDEVKTHYEATVAAIKALLAKYF